MIEKLEIIKLFLEIVILFIALLSWKLIYETFLYIKESRIKNIKTTIELLNYYDKELDELLLNINSINEPLSFEILKIFWIINSLDEVVLLNRKDKNYIIYKNFLNNIYFKIYFNFLQNKLINKEIDLTTKQYSKLVFSKKIENYIKCSTGKKNTYNNILKIFEGFLNYSQEVVK